MPLVPKREDVLLEHQAVLCCAGDGELARVVQRGSRASSLEILRSCLERGLSNLLWMSLTEQGLEQMDLEVLPHLNQSLHPWTSCLCWNQILAFLLINLSSLSFLGVWSLVSDCNTTHLFFMKNLIPCDEWLWMRRNLYVFTGCQIYIVYLFILQDIIMYTLIQCQCEHASLKWRWIFQYLAKYPWSLFT